MVGGAETTLAGKSNAAECKGRTHGRQRGVMDGVNGISRFRDLARAPQTIHVTGHANY